MADIIRLLPDSVANQIAAGEVIQRPSSVIKELVENAIDAGASLVQIVITDAGKTSIQVIDNGKGMSITDARLAFERHATSKITDAADLFALRTMGFRGEALASIAAVAQVELRTRTTDDELGVSLNIEGGRVKEQEMISCPVGANFIVKNLFFNIPARRKFLKSNQTELSNILMEFERVALANPHVGFTLHSGSTLLQNLPGGNFKQRILNIFGKKMDSQLIPIKVETSLIKVNGYIGSPHSAKKKGVHQFFFVNGRFMRHAYFNKAIQAGYDRLIPEGEQVSYFISFTIDPGQIDVNIHPSKTEIKFQEEQAIWPILLAAVREALGRFNATPTIDFDMANRPQIPVFSNDKSGVIPPKVRIKADYNPFEVAAESSGKRIFTPVFPSSISSPDDWKPAFDMAYSADAKHEQGDISPATAHPTLYEGLSKDETEEWEVEHVVLAQYLGRFILARTPGGLLFVDQHRAHVRVLYDRYKERLNNKKGMVQGLLFPQLLTLSPSSAVLLDSIMEQLSAVGFDISPLGGGSFSILGIPSGTEGLDPVSLVQGLVDDALKGEVLVKEQIDHLIAVSLANKAAIPVGQELDVKEMTDLLVKLFHSSNPNLTPDGALIVKVVPESQVENWFL